MTADDQRKQLHCRITAIYGRDIADAILILLDAVIKTDDVEAWSIIGHAMEHLVPTL